MVAESEGNRQPEPPTPAKDPKGHRTAPDHNEKGWPGGVPYIIGNEGCERFSYYGMRAILTLYLAFLFQETGMVAEAANAKATSVYHYFAAGVYFVPILGAIIADRLLGKYRTILWLSMVYTLGHLVLSLGEGSVTGTYAGLVLIALGSGGIKPCVSAHVGDQFGKGNWHLLSVMYQAFY
ncbi:MAG: MFS transporter, partial [Myxococcota bacterium]